MLLASLVLTGCSSGETIDLSNPVPTDSVVIGTQEPNVATNSEAAESRSVDESPTDVDAACGVLDEAIGNWEEGKSTVRTIEKWQERTDIGKEATKEFDWNTVRKTINFYKNNADTLELNYPSEDFSQMIEECWYGTVNQKGKWAQALVENVATLKRIFQDSDLYERECYNMKDRPQSICFLAFFMILGEELGDDKDDSSSLVRAGFDDVTDLLRPALTNGSKVFDSD